MFEQPQSYDEFGKVQPKRTYIRRSPKKKQEPEVEAEVVVKEEHEVTSTPKIEAKVEKNLTMNDLAAYEGLTLEQYKERLNSRLKNQITELQKQFRKEEVAKRDLDKNISDAYGLLDFLQSPDRKDEGLLKLDPSRFKKIQNELSRLIDESAAPELGKIFVVPRIAALDAAVEVLYELYEKEKLDDQRSEPGILGALRLLSKEKLRRADYIREVQKWAKEMRLNVRNIIHQMLHEPQLILTPKEREILERLQTQMDDIVRFTKQ